MTTSTDTDRLMRNGLSYAQARENSKRVAHEAWCRARDRGCSVNAADRAYAAAYENEMRWHESGR